MDLEVVGRHALFFDDDAMAAFVNSGDALVEWNSLPIDRYDVRHLLTGPPPPRKRRRHHNHGRSSSSPPPPDHSLEPELELERYLDLPSPSDEQEVNNSFKPEDSGAYHSVGFSYGKPHDYTDQKDADAGPGCAGFRPPFPIPESLLQNLPPTEKVHQIIARTAVFVSKHGGQSEIVLRVKHGDHPTFGFLMPDHHLHTYFRFLVDHIEFLESDVDGKSQEDDNSQAGGIGGAGALSLLGSVYGSGEDEDGVIEDAPESVERKRMETSDALHSTTHNGSGQTDVSVSVSKKDETTSKHPLSSKEKDPLSKRIGFNHTAKGGKKGDALVPRSAVVNKSQAFPVPNAPKVDALILEPPADIKRVIDKIVEFILKNGRDFEAVLIEQDSKHGRFPFLLPADKHHSYYLKVLQKAQESKVIGKKDDPASHGVEKKDDTESLGSADHDIPYDSDRKEKFKMVLGKSKKDGPDQPSKPTQQQFGVSMDATAAAAILQAATRGIKNPNLDFFPKTSFNGSNHGFSSEGGQASSLGTLLSSQLQSTNPKPDLNVDPGVSVPVAKAIAKTAALAAASEGDSSEASLSREQKLKAERLKRAKMFAAMIKSGAAPQKNEPPRGLSVEPPESRVSGSGTQLMNVFGKEREGSSVPPDADVLDKNEKSEMKYADDEYNKRRSKRKYRSRTNRHEEEDVSEEEEEEEDEVGKGDERSRKHSRKKHRSHHSSHHSQDRRKHRKRHSKDKESRHRHKHNESSTDDDDHHHHRRRSSKHRKRSRSEREMELEEGEISTKYSDQSKASVADGCSGEASPDVSYSADEGRATSEPPKVAEVSDDLRAKVRAMLLANL